MFITVNSKHILNDTQYKNGTHHSTKFIVTISMFQILFQFDSNVVMVSFISQMTFCCTELRESYRCIYNWNIPHNLILDSVLQTPASALFIVLQTVYLFCIKSLSFHRLLDFLLIGISCIFLECHTSTNPAVQQQGVQAKTGFSLLVDTQRGMCQCGLQVNTHQPKQKRAK